MNDIALTPEEIEAAEIADIKKPIPDEHDKTIIRFDARTRPHYWIYEKGVDVWNRWGEDKLTDAEKITITANIKKYCGADEDLPSPDKVIDFSYTIWKDYVNFFSANFTQNTHFISATFTQDADFEKATFIQWADFRKSTFIQVVYFRGAIFYDSALFIEVKFERYVPDFEGAKIEGYIDFSAKKNNFPNCRPNFDADYISTKYSVLKSAMKKMEFADKELFFHGKELEAKYYNKKEPRRLRALYGYYGAFSNYGQSILRPLIGLGLTIFAAFLAYYKHSELFEPTLIYARKVGNIPQAIYSAFYYTIPFLQSDTVLHEMAFELENLCCHSPNKFSCAKAFSAIRGVQGIVSLFWLFLIGLGLRNNLRMR